ncbi:DUF7344 domain-containing protein [Natronorubrum aibiense]|uniref:DUF7344 domain-containing protein n=1 Tax=Natronorubrum aibiense TaxID=348826 RepID=A0A5P9P005_9EURY|nr:hypothetical protein [Natronorubrum aibiense]QFU81433.1 hypothetical protein GCU68_02105 [Natronorubrum aibiense]
MTDRNVVGESDVTQTTLSFELLNDPCRRALFWSVLRIQTDVIELETLVDHIVVRTASSAEPDLDRRAIKTELRHVHVPMLADADLLEYDPNDDVVRVDRAALIDCLECVQSTVADLQLPRLNCD